MKPTALLFLVCAGLAVLGQALFDRKGVGDRPPPKPAAIEQSRATAIGAQRVAMPGSADGPQPQLDHGSGW